MFISLLFHHSENSRTWVLLLRMTFFLFFLSTALISNAQPRTITDLSGKGWKLWYDKDAAWNTDELFLPGTPVAAIYAAGPTGGWNVLNTTKARDVNVPGTVEGIFTNTILAGR